MPSPLRVAVLECDVTLPKTTAKYGGYGGLYKALLEDGIEAMNRPEVITKEGLEVTKWDVEKTETYPKVEDVDGVIISGSKHNSWENRPWIVKLVEWTKEVLAEGRVRVVGICFGHQIVGRALDVKVGRSDQGWETSVLPVELTEQGKEMFGQDTLSLMQMHKDIVFSVPRGVIQLGRSRLCENQGMYQKRKVFTVQAHPEFSAEVMTEIVTARHQQGIFDDGMYEDAMRRVGERNDGVVVAKAILRFLLED